MVSLNSWATRLPQCRDMWRIGACGGSGLVHLFSTVCSCDGVVRPILSEISAVGSSRVPREIRTIQSLIQKIELLL